jgi:dethiobiotin synthetase
MAAALRRLSAEGRFPAAEIRVWKPVQTGVVSAGHCDADSFRLAVEGGLTQKPRDIATLTYAEPLAPWMAARRAGETIDYAALLADGRRRLGDGDFLLVEGAGGLAVPITKTKLIAHLAAELGLPVLIVARAGLGTVNHTLLTVALARNSGIRVAGVVLNGAAAHTEADRLSVEENAEMIAAFGEVPVVGTLPWTEQADGASSPNWIDTMITRLDWTTLLGE